MKIYLNLWLLLLLGCRGERSLKVQVYPGFGWDHLRFLDMSPIYDVSNFNDSDKFQSCIELIPLHENKIELASTEMDMYNSHSSDYSSNLMIGGSAGYLGFKISGSYSKEYQTAKKEQGQEKTVVLRNEINYLMVDAIIQSSCPVHPQVKKDIANIAKHQSNNESLLATYYAQLFVKKYGTHVTSRLYLGGSIVEENFISHSDYYSSTTSKNAYKAAAEASFRATVNEHKNRIQRKVVSSKGGDVFILGGHMEAWQASIKTNPAIVRRSIENITYFIQTDQFPEMTEVALTNVRKEIEQAVNSYVEMNTIRGCMDRNSPSFNWVSNVADSSCAPISQSTQFGGFIRTCSEDSRMSSHCYYLRQNNYYTGNDQCVYGFNKYLLHTSSQYQSLYRQNCWKCGFLWLKTCCEDVYVGQGRRELYLYVCNRNATQRSGSYSSIDVQSTYLFGGSYASQKVNPVTNAFTCPDSLFVAYDINGIRVCLAERTPTSRKDLPRYGGMYSCQYGNMATRTHVKGCSEGYSAYAIGSIDGNCALEVCLKFETTSDQRELPSVALPPFFSIDTIYSQVGANETSTDDISTNETTAYDTITTQMI
ncbi:unnamed protein product [Adineta ricciae]|uniref:MACPF domain-containing protein n=1 Tax=Adineta ricciae TaxID=249248 RepID=A0A816C5L8_ADIRI|nr:unnamed protein product [Adineta ricciae]CAF1619056.1 unnamed protein product [Adineta ricciae]